MLCIGAEKLNLKPKETLTPNPKSDKNCGGAGSKIVNPTARLKGIGIEPTGIPTEPGDAATAMASDQPGNSLGIR